MILSKTVNQEVYDDTNATTSMNVDVAADPMIKTDQGTGEDTTKFTEPSKEEKITKHSTEIDDVAVKEKISGPPIKLPGKD